MDRRSWLWRRKSSEKSPGETESSGGSISSHSERFSDDQVYMNQNSQSLEVMSKGEPHHDEFNENLSEKLSAALLSISAKEDLVKQHSKVAEEAVSGWEKAESEVLALRQQIEVINLRNSTLEDRIGHLDGALKECLRQLRQTRDEKDQQIHEIIEIKTSEWKITKSELEKQISDLSSQLQNARTETSIDVDLRSKLEMAEKENSALKLEISSMAEELEMRLIERELSNQAAEQASKHHLESVKKAAKFESECRKLKSTLQKASANFDHRSFTDSQSDIWERISVVESDVFKGSNEIERNRISPSMEINLMDDFLEMERLVALPESQPRGELEAMVNQSSELEERLKNVEKEKMKLEIVLKERENELKTSRNLLEKAESKLVEMESLLTSSNDAKEVAKKELELTKSTVKYLEKRVKRGEIEIKSQLDIARREAESRLEAEMELLLRKVEYLENEVQNERALSEKMGAKCRELEDEILKLQHEVEFPKAAKRNEDLRIKQDSELAMAGNKFAECQKTIASLSRQLKTLATLDDFLINTMDSVELSQDFSKKLLSGEER